MNQSSKKTSSVIYAIGILGAVAVVGIVVAKVSSVVKPADLTEARNKERLEFRGEVLAATTETLAKAGVVDPAHSTYRIPVETAKEIMLREWKNPAAGRAALLKRLDKANAQLANPFE